MSFLTPVVLIVFNRPDLTRLVFDAVAQAKPKKLLVVADGPRFLEEAEKCQQARDIIKNITWDCEVLTNFSDENLGCKYRVSTGLDWVFSMVEEAIILEDDCLPTQSFFYFCQTLLERYRYDTRVMHISGNNFQGGKKRTNYSYFFSKYSHVWGWASWRRAWRHYDVQMSTWPEYKSSDYIKLICGSRREQKYWIDIFDHVFNDRIDTWDYQWTYACWSQNGLSILPELNLVSNIGFRSDATHTKQKNIFANLPTFEIQDLTHPLLVVRNEQADAHTARYMFNTEFKLKAFMSKLKYSVLLKYLQSNKLRSY
ncbi:glycosyltransferase family 2 protein [Trichocoleus sp. FACHB-262]|uniref:glycosyltransferase family 2 protein n=1 Tax=Trichocoleus sp. FACHB-262 TaxID=2692869 RepID=UPI0016826B6D|nr:glycosyltransferase family 2 protein [Trichocoleus sp. FACHB-262]MBD2124682.1 glycosyltransferase family 2 protein [Trichocoleus sp. FACHB-262]